MAVLAGAHIAVRRHRKLGKDLATADVGCLLAEVCKDDYCSSCHPYCCDGRCAVDGKVRWSGVL